MDILKFVALLISILLYFLNFYTGVLGTTTLIVDPNVGNVNENNSITMLCYHQTDLTSDYTVSWHTASSETVAIYSTVDDTVSVEPEFSEYFHASYASSSKLLSLTLLSANVTLHSQTFQCQIITFEDGNKIGYFTLFVNFIRQPIITPPNDPMIDQKPAEFICDAEGQPDPTYQWKIGSDDTISNLCGITNGSYLCSEDGSILNITKVDFFYHNTDFTCTAVNEAGSEESEPVIPNIDFDFFYCVTMKLSSKSHTNHGLMCSLIEFTLAVESYPEIFTKDGGNTFSSEVSFSTNVDDNVKWFKATELDITCNNLVAERTICHSHFNSCWTPIILIIVFVVVVPIIIIIIVIILYHKSKDNSKVQSDGANLDSKSSVNIEEEGYPLAKNSLEKSVFSVDNGDEQYAKKKKKKRKNSNKVILAPLKSGKK